MEHTCPNCGHEFEQEPEHPDDAVECPSCAHSGEHDEFQTE